MAPKACISMWYGTFTHRAVVSNGYELCKETGGIALHAQVQSKDITKQGFRTPLASHTLEALLHAKKKNIFSFNNCRWSSLLAIWLLNFSWLTWRVYYWKRSVEKLVYKVLPYFPNESSLPNSQTKTKPRVPIHLGWPHESVISTEFCQAVKGILFRTSVDIQEFWSFQNTASKTIFVYPSPYCYHLA